MITFFVVLVLGTVAAGIVAGNMKTQETERENRLLQSYMLNMQGLYQSIQGRVDAARQYRHDLAKHIMTLEKLLEQQEQDEAVQFYMDDLKNHYELLRSGRYSSDEVVNSILVLKKTECDEKNIPFFIWVEPGEYSVIKEVDMTGLLYNLFDNAIEENERITDVDGRGIWFRMEKEEEKVKIQVKNKCVPGKKISFRTSKENAEEHGIGTKIIEKLVEEYHGTKALSMDKTEHIFYKNIVLMGETECTYQQK